MKRAARVVAGSFVVAVGFLACGDDDSTPAPAPTIDGAAPDTNAPKVDASSGADGGVDSSSPADAGQDSSAEASTDASTTITVTGKIISYGVPVANAAVIVAGKTPVTTSVLGTFTVPDVKPPYDVAFASSTTRITVYQGLTRADVVLVAYGPNGVPLPTQHQTTDLTGQVGGGPGLPFTDAPIVTISGGSALSGLATANATTGNYAMSSVQPPTWFGPATTIVGRVHAMLMQGAVGSEKGYYGKATADVSLTDGSLPGGQNVVLDEVGMAEMTIDGDGPLAYNDSPKLDLRPGIKVEEAGGGYFSPQPGGLTLPFSVKRKFVKVPGASLYAELLYNRFAKDTESSLVRASATAATTVTVTPVLAEPPRPSAPAAGTTNVNATTSFEFSKFTGGVHRVSFVSDGNPTVTVFTTATSVKLPDLAAFTLALPKGALYTWRVFGYGPLTSLDDPKLASIIDVPDTNLPPVADARIAASETRTFTTAP